MEIRLKNRNEKLIEIRRILNATQKDMANNGLTREYISMIESGKRNLSREAAILVMKNALDYARERNIDLNLDEEFIARTEEEDLCKICEGISETIENLQSCNEIVRFAHDNNFKLAEINGLKKVANILLIDKQYKEAFKEYTLCLNKIDEINSNILKENIYNCIGIVKMELTQYEEALIYYKEALNYCYINNKFDIKSKVIYNLALTYHNIGKYEKSLEYIENILKEKLENRLYVKFRILQGLNYHNMKRLDEAIEIYLDTIKHKDIDINSKIKVYNNIAMCYMNKGNLDTSLIYSDLALKSSANIPDLLNKTLQNRGKINKQMGRYEEAKKYFYEGLKISEEIMDYEYQLKSLKEIHSIADKQEDSEEGLKAVTKILDIAKANNLKADMAWALDVIINYAITCNDINILKIANDVKI